MPLSIHNFFTYTSHTYTSPQRVRKKKEKKNINQESLFSVLLLLSSQHPPLPPWPRDPPHWILLPDLHFPAPRREPATGQGRHSPPSSSRSTATNLRVHARAKLPPHCPQLGHPELLFFPCSADDPLAPPAPPQTDRPPPLLQPRSHAPPRRIHIGYGSSPPSSIPVHELSADDPADGIHPLVLSVTEKGGEEVSFSWIGIDPIRSRPELLPEPEPWPNSPFTSNFLLLHLEPPHIAVTMTSPAKSLSFSLEESDAEVDSPPRSASDPELQPQFEP